MNMNIGILFKEIHNNIIFNEYCKELTFDNQQEIINKVFNNSDLINVLLNIVNDVEIVKSKIELIVGQKVKKILPIQKQIIEEVKIDVEECIQRFYYQKTTLFTVISCV